MLIRNVKLLTAHLEELQSFYSVILELPIKEVSHDSFTVQVGLSSLTFERAIDSGEKPFYHFAMDISNNKLAEAIHWLGDKGVRLNELPNSSTAYYSASWDSTSIYFYDHAGNILEFIAKHGLDNYSEGPFRSIDLLRISEIGLVVPNVPAARESLHATFSLDAYKEDDDKFSAVGDEFGLFILSEHKRIWLGSNRLAEIYKTEVEIACAEEREYAYVGLPYRILSIKST
jgi:catechol-2,3-dioxygenase